MDFADILASSIHDIKNSFGLILNSLDELLSNPANHLADPRQANLLKHEIRRANNNLVQLLTLYRLGNEQFPLRISANNVADFLEEVVADNQAVCLALGLDLSDQCDPTLEGYFDLELVRGILDSTIGNAQRYAHGRILLSAASEQGYLVIRVEDDGAGFPDELCRWAPEMEARPTSSISSGRTRLGLYFAHQISQLHRAGGKIGGIRVYNGHQLPGGCFELFLP